MAHDENLTREMTAVLTADVKTALGALPEPHTGAQVLEAARASAATLSASFDVRSSGTSSVRITSA